MKKKKNNHRLPTVSRKDGRDALRKIGFLFLNFVVIFLAFRAIIALSERWENILIYYIGTGVYVLGTVALFVAYFVLNGFTFSKEPRTEEELPRKWSEEQKASFLANQSENRRKADKLLYVIFPLVVTLAISYIELYLIG